MGSSVIVVATCHVIVDVLANVDSVPTNVPAFPGSQVRIPVTAGTQKTRFYES